jgi:MFS family permease
MNPPRRLYGWVIVVLGALAMAATLPGRTHGLALITESLIKDLRVDRLDFAWINVIATLIGASFCLPFGWAIDRFGLRLVTTFLLVATGASAWALVRLEGGFLPLLFVITLTRGFGQSALSVASITSVGKWFPKRSGPPMGVYAFLVGLFFSSAFPLVGGMIRHHGWRSAWTVVSAVVALGIAPLVLLLMREPPAAVEPSSPELPVTGYTLNQALRTYAFWTFAGAASLYGLVSSGLGLWQQAVLAERGFGIETYHQVLTVTFALALTAQLLSGLLSSFLSLGTLNALAMFFYAGALAMIPFISTPTTLWISACLMGLSGGIITVVFFAVWSQAFGQAQLGRIQAASQMLTVLASAVGPLIFESVHRHSGSYAPALLGLAPIVLVFGIAGWKVRFPGAAA